MTTLMPLVSVTGLVLLLLTAAPTSCNRLTPGSHLPPFSRGEVKGEDMSATGVVIDNVVDVKAEGFVEKDTKAYELTESALKDDVLQTLETTGLSADNHDGLPPLQSVEQGTKVTSSRLRRAPQKTAIDAALKCALEDKYITLKGKTGCRKRDHKCPLAKGSSQYSYTLVESKDGYPIITRVDRNTKEEKVFMYKDEAQSP